MTCFLLNRHPPGDSFDHVSFTPRLLISCDPEWIDVAELGNEDSKETIFQTKGIPQKPVVQMVVAT